MVDYASKTVAQLQDILRSRSLPHSGKKAELIARLEESDVVASQKEEPQAAAEDGAFGARNLPT
jgi:SAP domain-containing ribonucleoprotein